MRRDFSQRVLGYCAVFFLLNWAAQAQNDTAQNTSSMPLWQNDTGFSTAVDYPGTPFGTGLCPDQKAEFLRYCVATLFSLTIQNISAAAAVVIYSQISPDFHYKTVKRLFGYEHVLVVEPSTASIERVGQCLNGNMTRVVDGLVAQEEKGEDVFSDNLAGSSTPCQISTHYKFIDMTLRAGVTGLTATGCVLFLENATRIMEQCVNDESSKQLLALLTLLALYPVVAAIYAGYNAISNNKNFCESFGKALLFPVEVAKACVSGRNRRYESGSSPY